MKMPYIFTLVLFSALLTANAQEYSRTPSGVKSIIAGMVIEIQFYSPSLIRVIKYPVGKSYIKQSLSVVKSPDNQNIGLKKKGKTLILSNKSVEVLLDLENGKISFKKLDGTILLNEKASSLKDFDDAGRKTYSPAQSFVLDKDESIYGLGILQNGKMSQRNQKIRMVQNNTWDFVTFFQSIKGYGLFWDNYSPTTFADDENETSFSSEVGEGIDYYLMYGGNADGVIACMRDLTGQVPMFPLWTYGFWQSKERYKSQAELVDVVKKYRELQVPIDGIIQDWQYWGNNYLWNAMDFLNPEFPDPEKMVDEIHQLNSHLLISVWSSFGLATRQYKKLDSIGALFNIKTWPESGLETWPPNLSYPSGVRVYDAYNPKARDIYWAFLNKGLFSKNIDGWWMDSTEPDHLSFKESDLDTKTHLGSFRSVRNAYPLMTVGGVYDHQRATTNKKRVFILTRSAFAGQQRYGANTWSGDITSSWESLRNQIPAGLNFSLCGIPYWNGDIGGFFAGAYNQKWNDATGAKNPLFQELYVRWLQFGTFTPMMRSHGADVPREIYQFGKKGEQVYDAIEQSINLRYALLPYIYSTARSVSNEQSSMMRALVMDFRNDERVADMNNEYLFGKSVLVAPVINAQYTQEKPIIVNKQTGWNKTDSVAKPQSEAVDFKQIKTKNIYLPKGTQWYDFWTNQVYNGGQQITKQTDLSTIPLYIRAGSIIPIGPKVQFATEKKWDDLEIRIYDGSDGQFTLYEDENDNYNYEKGAYSSITFTWNARSKMLTIGPRQGNFSGMLLKRTFRLTKVQASHQKKSEVRITAYNGSKWSIKL